MKESVRILKNKIKNTIYKEDTPVCITLDEFNCPIYWTKKSEKYSWECFYNEIKGVTFTSPVNIAMALGAVAIGSINA